MFLHSLRNIFQNISRYSPKPYKLCATALLPLTFMGCDKGPNVASICQEFPSVCQQLSEDNWCRVERREVLMDYHRLQTSNNEDFQYYLLLALEDYAKCMDKASLIEHKKFKEKKTNRINNAIQAKAMIKDIAEKTAESDNPLLLYFHWSRFNDKESLAELLALEGSSAVENPESQFNLATYYIKRDLDKTQDLLFHALELYKVQDEINVEIFKSLTTLFLDQEQYKQAYVWLKILALYKPDDSALNEQTLELYKRKFNLNTEFLDRVANSTLDKITQGKFVSPNAES